MSDERFVGLQLGPISIVDEGIEPLLDTRAAAASGSTRC